MTNEYDVFVRLPGDQVVPIGSVSGWENLQRTLAYYVKLSSGAVVAVDARTHAIIAGVSGSEIDTPAKVAKAAAA